MTMIDKQTLTEKVNNLEVLLVSYHKANKDLITYCIVLEQQLLALNHNLLEIRKKNG